MARARARALPGGALPRDVHRRRRRHPRRLRGTACAGRERIRRAGDPAGRSRRSRRLVDASRHPLRGEANACRLRAPLAAARVRRERDGRSAPRAACRDAARRGNRRGDRATLDAHVESRRGPPHGGRRRDGPRRLRGARADRGARRVRSARASARSAVGQPVGDGRSSSAPSAIAWAASFRTCKRACCCSTRPGASRS